MASKFWSNQVYVVIWHWISSYTNTMSFYIGREASKLWKRICSETTTEVNLLLENWKFILGGLICQYIHGLAARGVHYFHRPGPILQDAGFFLLPELGQERAYVSETVFTFVFLSFVLWTFHPFIFKSKKIYTVLIWCRVLAFLVVFSNCLRSSGRIGIIASEEEDVPVAVEESYSGNYVVVFDPLPTLMLRFQVVLFLESIARMMSAISTRTLQVKKRSKFPDQETTNYGMINSRNRWTPWSNGQALFG